MFDLLRGSNPTEKTVLLSNAHPVWSTVLAGRFSVLDKWCEFARARAAEDKSAAVSRDTWTQVLAFATALGTSIDLARVADDDSWPSLLEEFVDWAATR
jgi:DCN1-like protein 1/2